MAWTAKGSIKGPSGADGATARVDPVYPHAILIDVGGAGGVDAREIELSSNSTHLLWRFVGDTAWTNLIALTAITGPQGTAGTPGAQGVQGSPGTQGIQGVQGIQGEKGVNNLVVVSTLGDVPPGTPVDTVIVTR